MEKQRSQRQNFGLVGFLSAPRTLSPKTVAGLRRL